jgi:tetratricopeptide (TPR) repeat protein
MGATEVPVLAMRPCLRPCVLVALLVVAVPAAAQPAASSPSAAPGTPAAPTESMSQATTTEQDMADAQARAHFRLGREYYEQGRFADAAKEFEVAYGMSGRGSLLFNVYLAYRDAQDTANAARALRGYLAATPDAADREHLSARLAALEATLQQAEADAERQRAEAAAAEAKTAEAERERAESDRRAAEAERRAQLRPSRPLWPWLVFGGGVAIAGTGVVLGVLASGDADDLRADCVADPRTDGAGAPLTGGSHCAPAVDLASRRDSIQTQALIADALWIGGAVIGVTGLVLAFALPDEYPELEESPVAAGCGPDGCHASLQLSF